MLTLPFLPDEVEVKVPVPGEKDEVVVVTFRPMDLFDKAAWIESCNKAEVSHNSALGFALGISSQLIKIDNLQVKDSAESPPRPFDPKKDRKRFPLWAVSPVWKEIQKYSDLSEGEVKN